MTRDVASDSVDSPHFCRTRTRLKKIGLGRGHTFSMEWCIIDFIYKIFAKYQFTNLLTRWTRNMFAGLGLEKKLTEAQSLIITIYLEIQMKFMITWNKFDQFFLMLEEIPFFGENIHPWG